MNFGATSDHHGSIVCSVEDLNDDNIETREMRENITSEVMNKSSYNADSIISVGLRLSFNTFLETMTDTIKGKVECLLKENSQTRKELREVRNIVDNIQDLSQKNKSSTTSRYRLERTMILYAVLENFDNSFDDCVIIKVIRAVIIHFLSTGPLFILMELSTIVEVI